MSDFDSPWKEALDTFFEAFLELFLPEAHADIDWAREYESLDKELQKIAPDGEIGRKYVDKLVKVWLKSGDELWVLVHIEVQTSEDPKFAWRMYIYNCRLFDRYNREVASIAVLGDDNPRWRPNRFGYRRWGVKAELEFPVVKLLDYVAKRHELEQSTNPFATVVLAHLDTLETRHDPGERKDRKFRLIRGLLERGWNESQVRQLFRVIDWMIDLPKPFEDAFWDQVKQFNEEKQMPFITTPERYGRQEGLAKGLGEGRAQGLAEGRVEGLAEGRVEGRVDGIEVALKIKFGSPALVLMPEIRQIKDEEKLASILHAIESTSSPDGLRQLWTD